MISPAFAGLPPHGRGQRIGLLGGSFNPPHDGHRAVSLLALRRLELAQVWWLVSPGNPLKDTRDLPSIENRVALAQRVAAHPRIAISAFEQKLGSRYTVDLITTVKRRTPGVKFVWIMGADAFAEFHLWRRWKSIADRIPLAIVDRPDFTLRAAHGRAAVALASARLPEFAARLLPDSLPPAFIFLHGKRSTLSSTDIRCTGGRSHTGGRAGEPHRR